MFELAAESNRMEVELEAVVAVVAAVAVELWDLFVAVPDYVKSIEKEPN